MSTGEEQARTDQFKINKLGSSRAESMETETEAEAEAGSCAPSVSSRFLHVGGRRKAVRDRLALQGGPGAFP